MKIFTIILFCLASFATTKTLFYSMYELKQKNKFGGICVILFSVISYLMFSILIFRQ